MAIRLDLGDIQGLFARGYREHRYARFTIFTIAEAPAGRALLEWLLPRITTAAPFSGDVALQVALLIPILASVLGLLTSFRMMRQPDPISSGIEGLVLA